MPLERKPKKYTVTVAQLAYGNIDVEANSRDEAKQKALELTKEDCSRVDWFESRSYKVAEVYSRDGGIDND